MPKIKAQRSTTATRFIATLHLIYNYIYKKSGSGVLSLRIDYFFDCDLCFVQLDPCYARVGAFGF